MSENKTETSYCLKCKNKVNVKDAEIKTTTNNRKYLSGICVECGTKVNKFLKSEKSKISEKLDELIKEDVVKNDDVVKDDVVKDDVIKKTRKVKVK